jgi:hypothetical protein
MSFKKIHFLTGCVVVTLLLTACEGLFSGLYDNDKLTEQEQEMAAAAAGRLYVDASDWEKWYYLDIQELRDSVNALKEKDSTAVYTYRWKEYDIPMERTEASDTPTGIYTYWYDVFGAGISVNERRDFYPTIEQPMPERWSIAVHRNNVRTNGASVYETGYTSIADLPGGKDAFTDCTFIEDQWSEKDVWVVQGQMLSGLIGNQGIKINPVLSQWLLVSIPPMPPQFTLNNHVFILRLNDGTYAALQLENYLNSAGKKCCLTINYKYPL